ncbi:unnamed protein product [Tilletia caries]|nr:unnamed protein product [Tilletia caries]
MVAPHLSSQITPAAQQSPPPEPSSMSGSESADSITPTNRSMSDTDKILEALQASTAATRMATLKMDKLESDIAELKTARSAATAELATPVLGDASTFPYTPYVLRPGPVQGVATRPGQTPAPATPKARGVSGFYVPITPKTKSKGPSSDHASLSGFVFGSGDEDLKHLDHTLDPAERIEASRRVSDERSKEVIELKSQLWTTCLAIVEKENRGDEKEDIVRKTDRMAAEHWLQIRKERIMRMFDPATRDNLPKDEHGQKGEKKDWLRAISQSAPSRITSKLTHDNFLAYTSQLIGLLAPIEFAQEILEGIEHGEDYLEGHPTEVTPNYNLRLDLEIGGLISGSVSDECRGYVFARQSTGEFRGSVIWRDLVGIMKRGDGRKGDDLGEGVGRAAESVGGRSPVG